jgi:hypothetical protein
MALSFLELLRYIARASHLANIPATELVLLILQYSAYNFLLIANPALRKQLKTLAYRPSSNDFGPTPLEALPLQLL